MRKSTGIPVPNEVYPDWYNKPDRPHAQSDRLAPKVVKLVDEGVSYRRIAEKLRISKTTVTEIMKRQQEPAIGMR